MKGTDWVLSVGQSGVAEIQLGKHPNCAGGELIWQVCNCRKLLCRAQKSFHIHANAAHDVAATPPPPPVSSLAMDILSHHGHHLLHSSSLNASTSIPSSSKLAGPPKNCSFHFSRSSHSSCVNLFTHTTGSHVESHHRAIALILHCLWAALKFSSHPHHTSQIICSDS